MQKTNSCTLLVISPNSFNYPKLFEDVKTLPNPSGEGVLNLLVDQANWSDITLTSYPDGVYCDISKSENPFPDTPQTRNRTIKPDLVLVRSLCHTVYPWDYRSVLYGFAHANIPVINSVQSLITCLERPLFFGKLKQIVNRVGFDKFPLIEQHYYSDFKAMKVTPAKYPIIVKIGHVHSGYGKIRIQDHSQFQDLKSCVALHRDYCSAESFVEADYDIRVQKIGKHLRAYKRIGTNAWKTNTGSSLLEDMEITEEFQYWIQQVDKEFKHQEAEELDESKASGFDIYALDAVYNSKTKQYYILEVNDSSIGLGPYHQEEDYQNMKQLVLEKLSYYLAKKANKNTVQNQQQASSSSPSTTTGVQQQYSSSEAQELEKQVKIANLENKVMDLQKQLHKAKQITKVESVAWKIQLLVIVILIAMLLQQSL